MKNYPVSLIGTRRQVSKAFRKFNTKQGVGYIGNVQLTRVGFRVWHLTFEAEVK